MYVNDRISISKIALCCVYLPPSLKLDEIDKFYDYMNCCYDQLCVESSSTAFIIAGDLYNTVLYNFDWSPVFNTGDIDEKVDVFQRITEALINESS